MGEMIWLFSLRIKLTEPACSDPDERAFSTDMPIQTFFANLCLICMLKFYHYEQWKIMMYHPQTI